MRQTGRQLGQDTPSAGPLTPGAGAESIAERITAAITLGQLAVGERLPTEAELADRFGVAVATLRKALAELRTQGLVETRRGRSGGTFVVRAPFPSATELGAALKQTSLAALRDFFDEHAAAAAAAARLAALRHANGNNTRLAEFAFKARDSRSERERALADTRFHIEIAILSQSSRLLAAVQRLQAELAPYLWSAALCNPLMQQVFNEHLAIAMAIESGKAKEAAALATAHAEQAQRLIIRAKLKLHRQDLPQTQNFAAVCEQINSLLNNCFASLQNLAADFTKHLKIKADGTLNLDEHTGRRLKTISARYLAENKLVDGCGLTFSRQVLSADRGHLEWWVREENNRLARYSFGVVPDGERYYDYEHHEWFTQAFINGTPAIVGPYLDYLGIESYVLTLTVPATVDGNRVGAVGNDIKLDDLEQTLLPLLLTSPGQTALLGQHGNIIFSNHEDLLPGMQLPDPDSYEYTPVGPQECELQLAHKRA